MNVLAVQSVSNQANDMRRMSRGACRVLFGDGIRDGLRQSAANSVCEHRRTFCWDLPLRQFTQRMQDVGSLHGERPIVFGEIRTAAATQGNSASNGEGNGAHACTRRVRARARA